jgi:hypothetical protein
MQYPDRLPGFVSHFSVDRFITCLRAARALEALGEAGNGREFNGEF